LRSFSPPFSRSSMDLYVEEIFSLPSFPVEGFKGHYLPLGKRRSPLPTPPFFLFGGGVIGSCFLFFFFPHIHLSRLPEEYVYFPFFPLPSLCREGPPLSPHFVCPSSGWLLPLFLCLWRTTSPPSFAGLFIAFLSFSHNEAADSLFFKYKESASLCRELNEKLPPFSNSPRNRRELIAVLFSGMSTLSSFPLGKNDGLSPFLPPPLSLVGSTVVFSFFPAE